MLDLYRLLQINLSDWDVQFYIMFWNITMNKLDTIVGILTTWHLEDNSQIERMNKIFNMFLRHPMATIDSNWVQKLYLIEFGSNTTPTMLLRFSPFKVLCGFETLRPLYHICTRLKDEHIQRFFFDGRTMWIAQRELILETTQNCFKKIQL